jgi:hypothetical protein
MALLAVFGLLGHTTPSAAQFCVGDCNGDGQVLIYELLVGVNIVLGDQPCERVHGARRRGAVW